MIVNRPNQKYEHLGVTYAIGAAVMATEASEYRGLYGAITEIRDGADRETKNDTPDIYCCFEPPLFQEEIRELERRFTELYQSPKKLDEITLDKIRRGLTTSHIGFVYEDICQDRMWELNVNNTWPFQFSKLGGYWDAKNEIDIAALDPEGKNLILGECKYWKEPVGLNVLHALETEACDVAWERDRRKVWYVLFSISGFSDELRNHAATRDDLLLIDDRGR